MPVEFKVGDLFDTTLPVIGHGVNVYGLMGSGIAPIVRRNFPAVFEPYRKACADKLLLPGEMWPVEVEPGKWVFNLASQDKPGRHARMEWLRASLEETFWTLNSLKLPGIALPRIGAGVGGLVWVDVKNEIVRQAEQHPHLIVEVWSLPGAPD